MTSLSLDLSERWSAPLVQYEYDNNKFGFLLPTGDAVVVDSLRIYYYSDNGKGQLNWTYSEFGTTGYVPVSDFVFVSFFVFFFSCFVFF